jgi:hypothetical protein
MRPVKGELDNEPPKCSVGLPEGLADTHYSRAGLWAIPLH